MLRKSKILARSSTRVYFCNRFNINRFYHWEFPENMHKYSIDFWQNLLPSFWLIFSGEKSLKQLMQLVTLTQSQKKCESESVNLNVRIWMSESECANLIVRIWKVWFRKVWIWKLWIWKCESETIDNGNVFSYYDIVSRSHIYSPLEHLQPC